MNSPEIVSFFIYKLISLLVGGFAIYLGYKLFTKGIVEKAGEVEGELGTAKLKVTRTAPGIFFSLFGAIIICYTLFKGFRYSETTTTTGEPSSSSSTPTQQKTTVDIGNTSDLNDNRNSVEIKDSTIRKNPRDTSRSVMVIGSPRLH